jgi:nickel-dependent lactate racemase
MLTGAPATIGSADERLEAGVVRDFVTAQLVSAGLDGRSVCVLVPDGTRACPLPLLVGAIYQALAGRASRLTVLVALGTHAPMSDQDLAAHLGCEPGTLPDRYPGLAVANHAWWDDASLVRLGTLSAARVAALSGGLLREPVPVRVNRAVTEHDVTLIAGPVLPHEVAGFSGGNKYFFPGVSGREFIDASHWLGALITSAEIIGTTGDTPVRAMIDEAAALVPGEHLALCLVTTAEDRAGADDGAGAEDGAGAGAGQRAGDGLHAISFGEPRAAWAAAARLSARVHIRYLDAPVRRVLSVIPGRYPDLWTGAKGFYKVEPVVADGGQVVLYAPHIRQVAATHPEIERIGYHCRDYFTSDWERFRHLHWSDLAHSTHLRGAGSYDETNGERGRVTVTLATGIPENVTRAVNLDYLNPAAVDLARWAAAADTLVVPNAGETLYRLRGC